MNNYKVSFFNGAGYEGALVVTAESADAAEIIAGEAADFYGYFFSCPDLTVVVPFEGADGITAHFLDYEEACRELASAWGFDSMGDAEVVLR